MPPAITGSAYLASERPNILFSMSGDHAARAISACGSRLAAIAPTPNIGRLKEFAAGKRNVRTWTANEDGILVPTSGGLADGWTYRRYRHEDLWPFKKINQEKVAEQGEHLVDWFLQRRMRAAGVAPAPQAEPLTLIRRATRY